jgi:hypothetical protein
LEATQYFRLIGRRRHQCDEPIRRLRTLGAS